VLVADARNRSTGVSSSRSRADVHVNRARPSVMPLVALWSGWWISEPRVLCDNHAVKLDEPRSLSEAERLILDALLAPDFPGAAELRAQLTRVQVVGKCDCGCPTVDLAVPPDVYPSPIKTTNRLAPVKGRVTPVAGEPPGDIILFVDDGRLSCLEYVSYDDPSPTGWPPLDRVTLVRTD